MTFKTFSDIPRSKSRFYYQVFETIYSKHDSVNKLSFRRPKVTNFKKEHFEELLNYFSYITLEKNKVTFSKKNLENDLERCKKLKKIPDFQITDLIEDLVVSINVIYKEGIYYSFPHKTLQEYFSACFIANLSFENKTNYYKKLSNDIAINPTQKSNYLSLLFEMDEINFSKYFLVPLFQEALKCLYGSFSRNYLEHSILIIEAIKNLGFKTSIKFGNNEKEFGRQISATITGLKHKIKTDILNEKKLI